MSQEERKLLQLMDERILNASPEELAKLQQADISTQLDGIWFYDICNLSDQISTKAGCYNQQTFFKIIMCISKFKCGFLAVRSYVN